MPTGADPTLPVGPAPCALGLGERSLQGGEVGGPEDEAVSGCDVHEVEVDSGSRNLSRQVGEDARPILDVNDDYFALAGHGDVGDRQRVLGRLGVRDEDVKLDLVSRSDA